jgi:hypothetical protein
MGAHRASDRLVRHIYSPSSASDRLV